MNDAMITTSRRGTATGVFAAGGVSARSRRYQLRRGLRTREGFSLLAFACILGHLLRSYLRIQMLRQQENVMSPKVNQLGASRSSTPAPDPDRVRA